MLIYAPDANTWHEGAPPQDQGLISYMCPKADSILDAVQETGGRKAPGPGSHITHVSQSGQYHGCSIEEDYAQTSTKIEDF